MPGDLSKEMETSETILRNALQAVESVQNLILIRRAYHMEN